MNDKKKLFDELFDVFLNNTFSKPINLTNKMIFDEEIDVQNQFSRKKILEISIEDLEVWETYTSPLIWMNAKSIYYFIPYYFKLMLENFDNLYMIESVVDLLNDILNEDGFSYTNVNEIYDCFNKEQRSYIIELLKFLSKDDFISICQSDWSSLNTISRIRNKSKETKKLWLSKEASKQI